LISTHNGIENLFNTIITDSRAGKKRYSVHRIDIELAISEGLYRRICQVTKKPWSPEAEAEWLANLLSDTATEEDAREEYYCEPKNGGGTYLARSIRERAARGPVPFCASPERLSSMPCRKSSVRWICRNGWIRWCCPC
jgi:phage FluMu gp28-like protein